MYTYLQDYGHGVPQGSNISLVILLINSLIFHWHTWIKDQKGYLDIRKHEKAKAWSYKMNFARSDILH